MICIEGAQLVLLYEEGGINADSGCNRDPFNILQHAKGVYSIYGFPVKPSIIKPEHYLLNCRSGAVYSRVNPVPNIYEYLL